MRPRARVTGCQYDVAFGTQEAVGEIPRIVVTASRPQADADPCDGPIPRVVVVGRRADLKVAAK